MSRSAFDAHQRARFMRPDAVRWIRSDIARFLKSGSTVSDLDADLRKSERKYSPDQPRDDWGRWTSGRLSKPFGVLGIDGTQSDELNDSGSDDVGSDAFDAEAATMFDIDPDSIGDSEDQLAQNRSRGSTSVSIGGQQFDLTPAQAARLTAAQANATEAVARIREIDPNWNPPESLYQSPEGLIRAYQSDASAAQVRANELASRGIMPGPFAGASIEARSSQRDFTAAERAEINRIGSEVGCNTCGTLDPGTPKGNFVIDHQLPSAINPLGRAQRLYPQCLSCSQAQGGWVNSLKGQR